MTVLCPYESESMPSEQPEIKLPPPKTLKYTLTLSDEEFALLADRDNCVTFNLFISAGLDAEVLIQRQAD